MTGDRHHVPDAEKCYRCGADVSPDKEGEYRHRFLLEDFARSSASEARGKLCSQCWWDMEEWVQNG